MEPKQHSRNSPFRVIRVKNNSLGIGYTILQTLAFFILIAALLESAARTSLASKLLPYRTFGSWHYQLDLKWSLLIQYVADNGGVDVIVIGNSLVDTGVVPEVIAQTYFEKTGLKLRVFNFGIGGLTVSPSSVNAKLLVDTYHPGLLIFVTEMRDYDATNGIRTKSKYLSDAWMQYQTGNFNPKGWLVDHSVALQHYLPYRNWMRTDFPNTFATYLNTVHATSATGYENDLARMKTDTIPDPRTSATNPYFSSLPYQIDSSRLEDLQSILDLAKDGGPHIIVVEMPAHPVFFEFAGGEAVHEAFKEKIAESVQAGGGIFLSATDEVTIPLDGRANPAHLNWKGAPIFSAYLGEKLAALTDQAGMMFVKKPEQK
jgi:hypothetical protein